MHPKKFHPFSTILRDSSLLLILVIPRDAHNPAINAQSKHLAWRQPCSLVSHALDTILATYLVVVSRRLRQTLVSRLMLSSRPVSANTRPVYTLYTVCYSFAATVITNNRGQPLVAGGRDRERSYLDDEETRSRGNYIDRSSPEDDGCSRVSPSLFERIQHSSRISTRKGKGRIFFHSKTLQVFRSSPSPFSLNG